MNSVLIFIKKLIPKKIFRFFQPAYHYILNFIAALSFGFPSQHISVVGITGTTGKTTVAYMAAQTLRYAGLRVGYTSTAMFSDGEKDWLNDKKMTMVGRFFTQWMLFRMVRNGCDVAIIETTSEGAVQFRHRFINYDTMLFTGLYPEHIESHGNFENYKKAKQSLFAHVGESRNKMLNNGKQYKTIIVNLDDEHAKDFVCFAADRKIGFTAESAHADESVEIVSYAYHHTTKTGVQFRFEDQDVQLKMLGEFNATNATAAGCICKTLGVRNSTIKKGLEKILQLPGRIERITEGQDFTVIVDYAFEPVAVTKLYETISVLEPKNIIHVLGSTGGGRDVSRRALLGKIAGKNAQYVIITNEDPYDDDPQEIMRGVAAGALAEQKVEGHDLFVIEDRRKAIHKAIDLAQKDDVVLITGKGSEQAIVGKDGVLIPWDDRLVASDEIKKHIYRDKNSLQ
jgi:UDP-N-acetylmuramoyl-L-alanyl-D-glutamate--2,6-diaminopimelate ligase